MKRDSRRKNHHESGTAASKRGTKSARRQGKETLESKPITEIRMPMEEHNNRQDKRVVFIDDVTNKPAMQLFHTAEGAQSTARLWADFLSATQSARDRLHGCKSSVVPPFTQKRSPAVGAPTVT